MGWANPKTTGSLPQELFKLQNRIGMKPSGISASTGSAAGRTWSLKIAAPCEFDAVRIFLYHLDTSATTVFQAITAATENALNNTAINLTRPIVGGAEQNALDATDNYGWKSVTWAGAATITPAAGTATSPTVSISDWISVSSIARSDGAAYPLLLVRMSVTGGTSGFHTWNSAFETASAANGGLIAQARWDADASGLMVTAPATNHMTASNSHLMPIGVEFRCLKRGITLLGIGDSLTQQNSVIADVHSTIGWRVAAAISALGVPCGYVNHGFSSQTMQTYSAAGSTAITNWKPNAVFIQSASPNNGNFNTDAFMRNGLRIMNSLAQGLVNDALAIRAAPFLTTWLPCNATIIPNESQDTMRRARNQYTIAQHGNSVFVLDWDSVVTDGGAPARIAAGYQFDTTHPNESAVTLLAEQAAGRLKEAFNLY